MRLLVSSVSVLIAVAAVGACVGDRPAALSDPPDAPDATTILQPDSSVTAPPSDAGKDGDDDVADANPQTDASPVEDASGMDAAADAGSPCERTSSFGPAVPLVTLGSPAFAPQLTRDELTIFFSRPVATDDAGTSRRRLFIARRGSTTSAFETPTEVTGLGTKPAEEDHDLFLYPVSNPLGHVLLLSSIRGAVYTNLDYYRVDADREFRGFTLGPKIPAISTGGLEGGASFTGDGRSMYFARYEYPDGAPEGRNILYRAAVTPSLTASAIAPVRGFESRTVSDGWAAVTPDDLALYFSSVADGAWRIHVARRSSVDAPFGEPERIADLDVMTIGTNSYNGWVSADECHLYFVRSSGVAQTDALIYVAARTPKSSAP